MFIRSSTYLENPIAGTLALLLVGGAIAGCGSSSSTSSVAASTSAAGTGTASTAPASGSTGSGSSASSGAPSGEAGAVYAAVLKFETTPDCDGITPAELKRLAGIGETKDQQCKIARQRSYPAASGVRVQAVRVTGDHATAQVPAQSGGVVVSQGGKAVVEKVTLVKQGGRWLISGAGD